jgi:hypothetical protein
MSHDRAARLAIVRCATSRDGAEIEVGPLRTSIDELPSGVDVVVLTAHGIDERTAAALASHGIPVATAHAGTDAMKRVAGGRLVETLDRSRLYVLRLPAAVEPGAIGAVLDVCRGERCLVADLVAPGHTIPALVDEEGRPVAGTFT